MSSVSIMNAAYMPGRMIPNMLADRIGPFNTMISCTFPFAVIMFALFGIKIVSAIVFGFASGAFLSLCAPAIASLSKDPSEVGIRFGIAFFLTAFGALTGTPIVGALLGTTFPWFKAITFSGTSVMAGVNCLIISRQMLVKRKGTQLV